MRANLKFTKLTVLAICLLIIAGIVFYYEEFRNNQNKEMKTMDVVVAVTDIPENSIFTKDMITTEKRYAEDVMKTSNIVTQYNEIVGKRTVVPIYKGETINNNRIIENKNYMSNKDQTQISLAINEVDKALELHQDDYIDIWLEPVSQGKDMQTTIEPYKLIKKIQIIKVHDSNYINIDKQKAASGAENITSNTEYVPSYLTIELPDAELKELYSIDKSKYNIRITRYGEEKLFNTIASVIRGE